MSRSGPAGGGWAAVTARRRPSPSGAGPVPLAPPATGPATEPAAPSATGPLAPSATGPAAVPATVPSAMPASWPSAWPSLRPRLLRRAVFFAAVEVLAAVGLVAVADLATQWWALLPPLLLLAGPATAPARARRRAERAAAAGRLVVGLDGLVRLGAAGRRPLARRQPDGTIHYLR